MPRPELRDYQRAALDAWCVLYSSMPGARAVIAHATGLGKTVLAAAWIAELVKQGRRVWFLAHRDELLNQAHDRIADWIDPRLILRLQAGLDDQPVLAGYEGRIPQVVIASIPTLARSPGNINKLGGIPDAVVMDEAHHAHAPTYRRILDQLAVWNVPVLGLTATPHRLDGQPLTDIWRQGIAHEVTLRDGIAGGYLSDLVTEQLEMQGDWAAPARGDYADDQLHNDFAANNAANVIAEGLQCYAQDRPTLVFVPTVEDAITTSLILETWRFKAAAIYGNLPLDERRQRIADYHAGYLQVLVTCAVLAEGFDAPRTSCIVIARPTRSQPLYLQMLGRGTRKHPAKRDCLVLDLVGATQRHDLVNVPGVLGLPPGAMQDIGAADALGHYPVIANRIPVRPFAWVPTDVGYALGCGAQHGTLLLRQLTDPRLGWACYQLRKGVPRNYLGRFALPEDAEHFAEDLTRRWGVDVLAGRAKNWRRLQATGAQLEALTKLGVPFVKNIRRGAAADLLTKCITERAWRR